MVNKVLKDYYENLYRADPESSMQTFLDAINLPPVTVEQLALLNALLSDKEVQATIMSFSNNKAPGPDRFTVEFFKSS